MADGTPTPTPTPVMRTPTPTPAPRPTRKVKLPPGIFGRTETKGEAGKKFKSFVEGFIPKGAEKSWVGISKEKQYAAARQNIIAVAAAGKKLKEQYGITDVQAAKYMVDLAKWGKKVKNAPPGMTAGYGPRPTPPKGK